MGIDWYGTRAIAVDVKLIPRDRELFQRERGRGTALSHNCHIAPRVHRISWQENIGINRNWLISPRIVRVQSWVRASFSETIPPLIYIYVQFSFYLLVKERLQD